MTVQATKEEYDIEKVRAEIGKLMAETSKINAEARWYPFVAAGGVFAAAAALIGLLVKFV